MSRFISEHWPPDIATDFAAGRRKLLRLSGRAGFKAILSESVAELRSVEWNRKGVEYP